MSSLSELVGLIYDAALDESRWQAFLDAFVQAIGAWCASVVPAAGQGNHVTRFWSSNLPKRNISGPAAEQLINHWYRSLGNEQTEGAIRTIDGSGAYPTLLVASDRTATTGNTHAFVILKADFIDAPAQILMLMGVM